MSEIALNSTLSAALKIAVLALPDDLTARCKPLIAASERSLNEWKAISEPRTRQAECAFLGTIVELKRIGVPVRTIERAIEKALTEVTNDKKFIPGSKPVEGLRQFHDDKLDAWLHLDSRQKESFDALAEHLKARKSIERGYYEFETGEQRYSIGTNLFPDMIKLGALGHYPTSVKDLAELLNSKL